jgi:hypothetical protein
MALEAAFEDLTSQLRKLRDVLQGVQLTAVEDRPERGAVVLVDEMGDAAEELLGQLEDALGAANKARRAAGPSLDLNRTRRHLAESQESFRPLSQTVYANLLSYERIAALLQFARERGRQWMAWVNSVRQGLERTRPALEAVDLAYFRCWQEIAERVGTSSVSLQATTIGQQITATLPSAKEIETEGLT